jgi:hypothetical protein
VASAIAPWEVAIGVQVPAHRPRSPPALAARDLTQRSLRLPARSGSGAAVGDTVARLGRMHLSPRAVTSVVVMPHKFRERCGICHPVTRLKPRVHAEAQVSPRKESSSPRPVLATASPLPNVLACVARPRAQRGERLYGWLDGIVARLRRSLRSPMRSFWKSTSARIDSHAQWRERIERKNRRQGTSAPTLAAAWSGPLEVLGEWCA